MITLLTPDNIAIMYHEAGEAAVCTLRHVRDDQGLVKVQTSLETESPRPRSGSLKCELDCRDGHLLSVSLSTLGLQLKSLNVN